MQDIEQTFPDSRDGHKKGITLRNKKLEAKLENMKSKADQAPGDPKKGGKAQPPPP